EQLLALTDVRVFARFRQEQRARSFQWTVGANVRTRRGREAVGVQWSHHTAFGALADYAAWTRSWMPRRSASPGGAMLRPPPTILRRRPGSRPGRSISSLPIKTRSLKPWRRATTRSLSTSMRPRLLVRPQQRP